MSEILTKIWFMDMVTLQCAKLKEKPLKHTLEIIRFLGLFETPDGFELIEHIRIVRSILQFIG